MKIALIIISCFVFLVVPQCGWAGDCSPLQISLFPTYQLVSAEKDVCGLRLNLPLGDNDNFYGLDLGFVGGTRNSVVSKLPREAGVKVRIEQPVSEETAVGPKPALKIADATPWKPVPKSTAEKFTNSLGMKFVYIKPGSFMMGSPSSEPGRDNNERQHKVTLTKGFYAQTTEVTQGQWKAVMRYNPSYFKHYGDGCPVEKVSWNDAQDFIKKLNQKEGSDKYRLPTEAEWEYACRAGTRTAFANGGISELECGYDSNLDAMGWYCGNSKKRTHLVAQKQPNNWGLYDMHGNVMEWCQDWYQNTYPSDFAIDPTGPSSGSHRVFRGDSWGSEAGDCRSASRNGAVYDGRVKYLGFRLALSPGQ